MRAHIVTLACLVVLLPAGLAGAEGFIDVEEIQRAIEEQGASWVAGPTPQTRMTAEEIDALVPDTLPHIVPPAPEVEQDGPPPPPPPDPSPDAARFSWHDYEGEDWMTDVKDQRTCGACWAFASLGAAEACYNVAIGNPHLDIDLSEQTAIACTDYGCDGGWGEAVFQYLLRTGVPDEQCYPYMALDTSCSDRCFDWEERSFSIARWGWILPWLSGERAVKERLVRGPIYTSMTVYADFMGYREGVYEHVTGDRLGGHAVTLVGWDDAHDSWIAKNSYGTSWGEDGYFEIRRGESDFGRDMVWVEVDASHLPGHPCISPSRQEVEVISGGMPLTVEFTLTNCGGEHLDWTTDPDPTTGWLSVGPDSGSSAVGETATLSATIDPASMTRIGPWAGSVLVHGGISDARGHLDIEVIAVAPTADFEAEPLTGPAPLTVQFTNTTHGTVEDLAWDFGDGESGTGRTPEHTYLEEGSYSVTLEVSGSEGSDVITREDLIVVLPSGTDPAGEETPDDPDDASEDVIEEEDQGGATPGCGCTLVH